MRRRVRYPLGVVGLVLVGFLLRGASERFVDAAVSSGLPWWAPTFGTVGQTVTVYLLAVSLFTLVVVPAGAFWLGVEYGRAADGSGTER
jgi:hypothetical protein